MEFLSLKELHRLPPLPQDQNLSAGALPHHHHHCRATASCCGSSRSDLATVCFMPPRFIRLGVPKATFTCVTPPEVCHILDVVWMPGKIVDPPGKMLAGLEMAGGVTVTLVLGGIE